MYPINGESARPCRRVASVVLNYNSDADLFKSVPQLAIQDDVHNSLIIVDNASSSECVQRVQAWILERYPNSIVGTVDEVDGWLKANLEEAKAAGRVYLILSKVNGGYSAGNNIGIRVASIIDAEAVLIANPDMRISDSRYLASLTEQMMTNPTACVAASSIRGVDGVKQNPMREASFLEELLWPLTLVRQRLTGKGYVLDVSSSHPVVVPKVSGCCMLIRMSFLREAGFLDENVFLYCEEPILSARVARLGGHIIYVPEITALHAHVASDKGSPASRMQLFVQSRLYYLRNYTGYSQWRIKLLEVSYAVLGWLHRRRATRQLNS